MSDPNRDPAHEPEDAVREPLAETEDGRRAFLRGVLGLGLANVAVSFFGAVPASATPQDADGDCAVWNQDTSTYSADDDCNHSGNSKDDDCGKANGQNSVHRDESCGAPEGKGFERDDDCGKPNGETYHGDIDCLSPAGPNPQVPQRDDVCGKPVGSGQNPPFHKDAVCAQPPNNFQSNRDMACNKPEGGTGGKTYADGSCSKPAPINHWTDHDCGKPTGQTTHTDENCNDPVPNSNGWVQKDANCGVQSPSGFATDAECGKPGAFGLPHEDNDCGLAPYNDSAQDDGG